jgi:hypothetical protein
MWLFVKPVAAKTPAWFQEEFLKAPLVSIYLTIYGSTTAFLKSQLPSFSDFCSQSSR